MPTVYPETVLESTDDNRGALGMTLALVNYTFDKNIIDSKYFNPHAAPTSLPHHLVFSFGGCAVTFLIDALS